MNEAIELPSSDHVLLFESGIPSPTYVPDGPNELLSFIRTNHKGLSRVTIKYEPARKRQAQINALAIGGTFDTLPTATPEQITRAIMAVCQDHHESLDEACRYYIQAHVYLKPTGDPKRRATHIEIGGMDGDYGASYAQHARSSEAWDDMMVRQQDTLFTRLMDQNRVISAMGEKAIAMQGQAFVMQEQALFARAEANQVVMDSRREDVDAKRRSDKWDRGFTMLEKALKSGMAQNAAAGIKARLAGPQAQPGLPQAVAALPSTPTPGWAAAAQGKPATVQATPAPAEPAPAEGPIDTTATEAPPEAVSEQVEVAEAQPGPEDEYVEPALEEDDSACAQATRLYASITAVQWPDLADALTRAQFKQLRAMQAPESDEQALKNVGKFKDGLKEATMIQLSGIFSHDQLSGVIALAMAADEASDDETPE